ncbi:UbiA prenyltransferase family protein [Thermoproteota archaeon]
MEKIGFFESSIVLIKSRREIIFASTWTSTLATIIAGKGIPPITESFLAIIANMLIVLSVYIYNDAIDKDMDAYSKKEKKKRRPIAQGIVSENNAMRFVYLTGLIGLGVCLSLSRIVFSIGFIYYILLVLYSYPGVRLKNVFIIKNLVSSLFMPTAFLMSGVAVENKISLSMSFLAFAYYILTVLVVPAIADMLDVEEDLAFNIPS